MRKLLLLALFLLPTSAFAIVCGLPVASPVAGTYTSAQSVSLTDASGCQICYTTDGTAPAGSAGNCTAGNYYTAAIAVNVTTTIKAMATLSGYSNSATVTVPYTINLPTGPPPQPSVFEVGTMTPIVQPRKARAG